MLGELCQEIDWLSVLQGSGRDQSAGKLFTGRFQWRAGQETGNRSSGGGRWMRL